MGSVGPSEILVILVVALLVLGPERLPAAMRQVGRVIGELRRVGAGFQSELRAAMDEVTPVRSAPPGPSAAIEGRIAPPPQADDGSARLSGADGEPAGR